MIPDTVIAEIRERVDIVALIGEFVRLKKRGNSHTGLCPFHQEKTPSFYVHAHRRFFHCFGCQVSGDVFNFLMRLEGHTFPEAARLLAERAGVEIPDADPTREAEVRRERQRDERLVAIVDAAAGYYLAQLDEHPHGAMARDAWRDRGVTDEVAERFRLGYAPAGWDGLTNFLRTKGYSPAEAESVGLIVPRKSKDGHYDRFRHRLMFPVSDRKGRVVAFSGRVLPAPPGAPPDDPEHKPAKYVNSPESALFTKSNVLYGLHEGRVQVRRRGWAVLCEGNFDLVKLHQAGFENACAPLGTAFTAEHAKLLKRYAERLVLLFDGDAAGGAAVRKTYDVIAAAGLPANVVTLPPGDDPDTFLTREGPEALQALIDGAPGIVEHLIDAAARAGRDASDKAKLIAELGPVLMKVSPVEVGLHIQRIARKFGIRDIEAVRQQLRSGVRSRRGRRAQPVSTVQRPRRKADLPPVEEGGFGALLDAPELFGTAEATKFGELLTSPDLRAMFDATARQVETHGGVEAPALLEDVREDPALAERAIVWLEGRLAVQKYDEAGAQAVLRDAIPRMEKKWRERRLRELKEAILDARGRGDHELARELTGEHMALLRGGAMTKRTTEKGDDGDEGSQFQDHSA